MPSAGTTPRQGYGRFTGTRLTKAEVEEAVDEAWAESERFKADMHRAGEEALEWVEQNHGPRHRFGGAPLPQ